MAILMQNSYFRHYEVVNKEKSIGELQNHSAGLPAFHPPYSQTLGEDKGLCYWNGDLRTDLLYSFNFCAGYDTSPLCFPKAVSNSVRE